MTSREFAARLGPYVDGELPVADLAAAEAHCAACADCARARDAEREFRALLRRQPREVAPPELRAWIVAAVRRRSGRVARTLRLVPIGALVAVLVAVTLLLPGRQGPDLVGALVDKHIAYAQLDRPAELASVDRDEVGGVVPPAGRPARDRARLLGLRHPSGRRPPGASPSRPARRPQP